MKAYQCDRCFQYYTANKEISVPGMGTDKIMTGMRYTLGSALSANDCSKQYELCDECARKLVDFMMFRNND